MTTWTSKAGAALLGCLGLSACSEGAGVEGILGALSLPGAEETAPLPPLRQALMMRGSVTLVPPAGFCIDPYSLKQNFALLARCDTLGAATGSRGAPIGLMTVSFTPSPAQTPLPTPSEFTQAAGLSAPERVLERSDHVLFTTRGAPPVEDVSDLHWRALARVDGYIFGAAVYGPEGKRALSIEGAGLLEDLIARTTAKS